MCRHRQSCPLNRNQRKSTSSQDPRASWCFTLQFGYGLPEPLCLVRSPSLAFQSLKWWRLPLGPLGFNFSQHGPTTRPSRRKDCRESIYALRIDKHRLSRVSHLVLGLMWSLLTYQGPSPSPAAIPRTSCKPPPRRFCRYCPRKGQAIPNTPL